MKRTVSLFALAALFVFGGVLSAGPLRDFFDRMKAKRHPAPTASAPAASKPAKPKLMKPGKPAPSCPTCPLPPKK